MKLVKIAVLCGLASVLAFPQTLEFGQGVYSNSDGAFDITVDASLVLHKLNSPYVMFMAFLGSKSEPRIDITRDTVVMVYNDREHRMPTVQELRKNYNGQRNDVSLYDSLGKQSLILSQARFLNFVEGTDFFPVLGSGTTIPASVATLTPSIGFKTKLYFKNPGLKKGDTLQIRVWGSRHPELKGEVTVILD